MQKILKIELLMNETSFWSMSVFCKLQKILMSIYNFIKLSLTSLVFYWTELFIKYWGFDLVQKNFKIEFLMNEEFILKICQDVVEVW